MHIGRAIRVVLACCVALVGSGCGGDASDGTGPAEDLTVVKYGLSGYNASHLWTIVARDHDIMERYGVKFEPIVFQAGASQVFPSLLGGSTHLGLHNTQTSMIAQQKDSELKMILSPMVGSPLSLIAREGIASIEELRGKTVSVNAVGASADYVDGAALLESRGIDTSEVNFITGGATSGRVSALLAGNVDAILASPPDVGRLTAEGAGVLGQPNDVPELANALSYAIVGKQSWLESNRETVVKFVQGYWATREFMHDPSNRDKVVTSIMKELNVEEEAAADTYEYWINDFGEDLDLTGRISEDKLRQALLNAQDGGIQELANVEPDSVDEYYDSSYVDDAVERGLKGEAGSSE